VKYALLALALGLLLGNALPRTWVTPTKAADWQGIDVAITPITMPNGTHVAKSVKVPGDRGLGISCVPGGKVDGHLAYTECFILSH
jgi:hypothetical protein